MHPDDDAIFDDDTLWTELLRPDDERRRTALRALDALGELAALRAHAAGVTYGVARHEIFSRRLLQNDLEQHGNGALHRAALRVWAAIAQLIELRQSAGTGTPVRRDATHVPSRG